MDARAKVALGLLGGYVLGRGKKARLATMILGYTLVKQGGKQLNSAKTTVLESDEAKTFFGQLTGGVTEAAKGAATAAAAKGVSSVTSNLKERTAQLQGAAGSGSDDGDEDDTTDSEDTTGSDEATDAEETPAETKSSEEKTEETPTRTSSGSSTPRTARKSPATSSSSSASRKPASTAKTIRSKAKDGEGGSNG